MVGHDPPQDEVANRKDKMSSLRILKSRILRILSNDWPRRKIEQLVKDATAEELCLSGPFKGMRYIDRSIGSEYYPKILGTYEKELAGIIEELSRSSFDQFIDIGAAEGYYAVGFALKTEWPIIAFEADPETPLPDLAKVNQVEDRITLKGACDLGDLQDALVKAKNSLVLVDVETAEFGLLDPRFIPELKSATLLVEVHDCFLHGIGDRLLSRFSESHTVERIECQSRTLTDFPVELPKLPFNPDLYIDYYLNERRPDGMYWLLMKPIA